MSGLKTVIGRMTPPPLKRLARLVRDHLRKKRLFGRLAPLVPPEPLMHDGPPTYEEFQQNGREFLELYRELGELKPDEAMLDVGCGIGRKTIYLTEYLSARARYEGIDIVRSGIDWCTKTIGRQRANFHFQLIDVYNHRYNPAGTRPASEYCFPFPDQTFDFVALGSVFTHMNAREVENYLSEVTRVLKPGGRSLISWFLMNPQSHELVRSGQSTLGFVHAIDVASWTVSSRVPEDATLSRSATSWVSTPERVSRSRLPSTTVHGAGGPSPCRIKISSSASDHREPAPSSHPSPSDRLVPVSWAVNRFRFTALA